MSDTLNLVNSIWPNGIQVDSDGYAIFYPLGTNKIDVPTSVSEWPKGDRLVSPFVYENDKLVGFCDTKAMTVSENTTVYLPYEHIEVDFSSIQYGTLQIHAPNATVKKAIWADSSSIDIPEAQFKYKGCTTVNDVTAITTDYQTTDIVNGNWSEPLWDLENGDGMFYRNSNLTTFTSDLSSLINGYSMFNDCSVLTTFKSNLSSLKYANSMFTYCPELETFAIDLPSLIDGLAMFGRSGLKNFNVKELPNLEVGARMFASVSFAQHTTFDTKMPNLIMGNGMFGSTINLETFTSDLSNLKSATTMFRNSFQLKQLYTRFDNLIDGHAMVSNSPLDVNSFMYIADSINDLKAKGYVQWDGSTWVPTGEDWHTISCINLNQDTLEYQILTQVVPNPGLITLTYDYETYLEGSNQFAQIVEYCKQIANKGWIVSLGGSSNIISPTNPTSIDNEATVQAMSHWFKPIPSNELFGEYVNANGEYFNIVGGRYIFGDDISTYGQFTSLEEAEQAMNLTKIERN